jgi:hypothetical protein
MFRLMLSTVSHRGLTPADLLLTPAQAFRVALSCTQLALNSADGSGDGSFTQLPTQLLCILLSCPYCCMHLLGIRFPTLSRHVPLNPPSEALVVSGLSHRMCSTHVLRLQQPLLQNARGHWSRGLDRQLDGLHALLLCLLRLALSSSNCQCSSNRLSNSACSSSFLLPQG